MAEKKTVPTMPSTKASKLNQYEAMFLFGPSATQDGPGALNTVRAMIEKHGGQVLVLKKWDERKLAYEINKQKRGTYIIAYFSAPGAAITPIERDVKLSEEVLRVMITDADHLVQKEMEAVEPQPIQRQEERNPWDRPSFNDRPPRGGDDRGPREGGRDDRGPRGPRREDAPAAGAPVAVAAEAGAGKD